MRLLEVCEPPDGGAALNATEVALGARRFGIEVEYAGPPESLFYPHLEESGVPVLRLPLAPSYFNTGRDARALRALRGLLSRGDYDVVHLHSAKAGVVGRLAAVRRAAVVYSPHSFSFVGDHSSLRTAVATTIERGLAPLSDAILCVCEWERKLALARHIAPPGRLRRIYNGCPSPPEGVEVTPELARMREEGPVIGAIAVLRRQKRLDILIEAAPAILAAEPSSHVVVVGNGPDRESLWAQAASLGLDREPRFRMLPFEGGSWRYLAGLDVFVLPSQWEALPIGVLEALASGVPQVATDVGGTAEAVVDGETGILVPPLRAGELARAVTSLLADPERRERMSAASRRRHRERFRAEAMVEQTLALYEELGARAA
jgi:glycosyltransferase involved in cell wall biosynthesis